MKSRLCQLLAGCLIVFSLGTCAAALPGIYSTQGQIILIQLVSAPFPHPQRSDGREYKGQFFSAKEHYTDSTVAMFIPRGFRETARIDFVVHFHGWKNHVAKVLEHYRLVEQFQETDVADWSCEGRGVAGRGGQRPDRHP